MRKSIFGSVLVLGMVMSAGAVQATPDLLAAAKAGDPDAVVEALEANTATSPTLGRALYFAAQRGHSEIVRLLLENGADPNTSFSYGSPLHAAARADDAAVVALLLEFGANPNLPGGGFDEAPLHDAAARGAFATAMMLLQHGADVNFRNAMGRPPIHVAAKSGNHAMVDLLRANGAVPRLPVPISESELDNANLAAGLRALHGCNTCHEIMEGKPATGIHVGPSLIGVFGAPRAARKDFAYSDAMAGLEGVWTAEALNAFLTDPTGVVPGTEMIRSPEMTREEMIGLIAVLRDASP